MNSPISARWTPRFSHLSTRASVFDGISYVVVDAGGTLHTGTFGDHTEDTVVMLASTSKVPAVMTLMALEEDPALRLQHEPADRRGAAL